MSNIKIEEVGRTLAPNEEHILRQAIIVCRRLDKDAEFYGHSPKSWARSCYEEARMSLQDMLLLHGEEK